MTPFAPSARVYWPARDLSGAVVSCSPCGWGGWWVTFVSDSGRTLGTHAWNLERAVERPVAIRRGTLRLAAVNGVAI